MAQEIPRKSQDRGQGFVEHGVAGPVSESRGMASTLDGNGKPVILVWLYDHRGCHSLLMLDGDTAKATTYDVPVPNGDAPYAFLLSSKNRFYACFADHFLEFDPVRRAFTFVGKGAGGPAMALTEDPQGLVWAANYPDGGLTSFNPVTRQMVNYGSLNKENWPQYPNLAIDKSGWVYLGIGNVKSQIVAFNPKTRETRPLVKEAERKPGPGIVFLGADSVVYGQSSPNGPWYVFSEGKAEPAQKPTVGHSAVKTAGWSSAILSPFPDGRKIKAIDVQDKWMDLEEKDGTVRRLTFDYPSEGAEIMSLVLGPDGKIYGATGQPLRVFAYDPVADTFTNHGWRGENGHWNAMTVARGHVFGALYGGGYLFDYDITQPWNDAAQGETNPKIPANGSAAIGRPHALLTHPDGRHLIMTGTPGYGRTGGGMMIYDLDAKKAELLTHEQLIPDQSTVALEPIGDGAVLVGGTTIGAGTGGELHAKSGELYLMDFATRKITFHAPIVPGAWEIRDFTVGPDGLVYGLAAGGAYGSNADPVYFVFDPKTQKVVHQEKPTGCGELTGGQGPRVTLLGPDGKIYAYFSKAIVRIEPGTFKLERLAVPPVTISVGIVLREGRLYFGSESRLWSWKVPGLK
jgi:streptogramin lyase